MTSIAHDWMLSTISASDWWNSVCCHSRCGAFCRSIDSSSPSSCSPLCSPLCRSSNSCSCVATRQCSLGAVSRTAVIQALIVEVAIVEVAIVEVLVVEVAILRSCEVSTPALDQTSACLELVHCTSIDLFAFWWRSAFRLQSAMFDMDCRDIVVTVRIDIGRSRPTLVMWHWLIWTGPLKLLRSPWVAVGFIPSPCLFRAKAVHTCR